MTIDEKRTAIFKSCEMIKSFASDNNIELVGTLYFGMDEPILMQFDGKD